MRKQTLFSIVILALSAPVASGELEAVGEAYKARSYFASGLENEQPIDKIDQADLSMEQVVLFTEWRALSDKLYHKEVRVYDPNDALISTWFFEFTPVRGTYNTWYWWCLCDYRDTPGVWRFEVYLDEEKAFENKIFISRKNDT